MTLIDNAPFSQANPTGSDEVSATSPTHAGQHAALNNEVTAIEGSMRDGYVRESNAVVRTGAQTFTVATDQTLYYTLGRRIVMDDAGTPVPATVASSSYDGGTGLTTVTIDAAATVPTPIGSVSLSLQQKGNTIVKMADLDDETKVKFGTASIGDVATVMANPYDFADVTGLEVELTLDVPSNVLAIFTGHYSGSSVNSTSYQILRDATVISDVQRSQIDPSTQLPVSLHGADAALAAGTYTFQVQVEHETNSGTLTTHSGSRLTVYAFPA